MEVFIELYPLIQQGEPQEHKVQNGSTGFKPRFFDYEKTVCFTGHQM